MRRRKSAPDEPVKTRTPVRAKSMRISATKGEELYAPLQYHNFKVGAVTVELEIDMSGEVDIADAVEQLREELEVAQQAEFDDQSARYLKRVKALGIEVKRLKAAF